MCVCMYVCMYVCTYVCIPTYFILTHIHNIQHAQVYASVYGTHCITPTPIFAGVVFKLVLTSVHRKQTDMHMHTCYAPS